MRNYYLIENNPVETSHKRIWKVNEDFPAFKDIDDFVASLDKVLNSENVEKIRKMLSELVPDYTPSDDIVDLIEIEEEPVHGSKILKAQNSPIVWLPV